MEIIKKLKFFLFIFLAIFSTFKLTFSEKIINEKKRKDLNKHRNRAKKSKNMILKRETFSRMLKEIFDINEIVKVSL